MKLLILLAVVATGTVFFAAKQKDITGTWVLDTKGNKCEAAVLRIQNSEGRYVAKLDIPEQQLYDKPVHLQVARDTITVWLDTAKTTFIKLAVNDSFFIGRSYVGDKYEPVSFYRVNN